MFAVRLRRLTEHDGLHRELIEPKNEEDEDDEDGEDEEDDDDDFIPRGPPARPTGHLGATPGRPVKTR